MLKAKITSIATTRSTCTRPCFSASTSSIAATPANSTPSIHDNPVVTNASSRYTSGTATTTPSSTHTTRMRLAASGAGRPTPCRPRRPNQNHSRLSSMPTPAAPNTTR